MKLRSNYRKKPEKSALKSIVIECGAYPCTSLAVDLKVISLSYQLPHPILEGLPMMVLTTAAGPSLPKSQNFLIELLNIWAQTAWGIGTSFITLTLIRETEVTVF
jgi:hypothetical protein